jgi:hypothetical protein
MRIGIDISQLAYEGVGVSKYLKNLIEHLSAVDTNNEYILFFSSLRRNPPRFQVGPNFKIKRMHIPPTALNFLWNKLHVLPVEKFVGEIDLFITSDWTEPPSKAKKATIVYDMIVYKSPEETDKKIVETQKRKLDLVKRESSKILTISESSKKDIVEILGIPENKIEVIYPGI